MIGLYHEGMQTAKRLSFYIHFFLFCFIELRTYFSSHFTSINKLSWYILFISWEAYSVVTSRQSMPTCSDLQTCDSANCSSPFRSVANASAGMCVLHNSLKTCQSKSYSKHLHLIALIFVHANSTTYKRVFEKEQLCEVCDPDFKDF